MQMFPDDLPLANIDADGYCCHFMRSSVRPTIHGLEFVYCIQSAWKKWPTIWHADVSRWLTLSIQYTCGYGGYLLPLLAAHSSFLLNFSFFPSDMANPTKSNTKKNDTNINSYIVIHLLKLKKSANQNAFMISLSTFHTRFHYTEFIFSDIHMHGYRNAACQMCTSSALSSAICSLPGTCITLTVKGFSLKVLSRC